MAAVQCSGCARKKDTRWIRTIKSRTISLVVVLPTRKPSSFSVSIWAPKKGYCIVCLSVQGWRPNQKLPRVMCAQALNHSFSQTKFKFLVEACRNERNRENGNCRIGNWDKENNFNRVETGKSNVLIRRKQFFIDNRINNYLIYHHAKIEKSQIR